jgi:hypothetical protein
MKYGFDGISCTDPFTFSHGEALHDGFDVEQVNSARVAQVGLYLNSGSTDPLTHSA